jgi:signal transduction histidine kinase
VKTGYGRFLKDPKDVVVALRLLVLAGLAMLGIGEPPRHSFLFWFTTCVYGVTNLGYLFSRAAHFASPRTQLSIFLFDIVVVSFLIVMRGSQVPQFIMAYFTLVLMAAVVQGLGSAIVNALFVCTVYAAITLWGREPVDLLTFPALSQFAFFLVVAVFMGHVAESAREQARERMRAEITNTRLEAAVQERTRDLRDSLEELRSARDRLQASDRLATLGMLSAGVAHDIRNPLAAIHAALEEAPALLDELEETGRGGGASDPVALLRSSVSDAQAACAQLSRLASDLTAVARSAPTMARPLPCREALEGTARLLRHRAKDGARIDVACSASVDAMADPGRLQQALVNLASNGLDAMEGRGGVLTLGAEDAGPGRIRFYVRDTGGGMPADVAARVFEPFFTTKGPGRGTGLGLHLVQEIAQAHGARVEFESHPGVGTCFRLDWPAAPATKETVPHDASQDSGADRGRRGEHSPGPRTDAPARAV